MLLRFAVPVLLAWIGQPCQGADSKTCGIMTALVPNYCKDRELALIQCPQQCQGIAQDPPSRPTVPKRDDMVLECCKQQGVPENCLGLCKYFPDPKTACKTECADSFRKWIYCAANNQDNSACCLRKGVPAHCLAFCNGREPFPFPKVNTMFGSIGSALVYSQCFSKGNDIMQCHYDSSSLSSQHTRNAGSWEGPQNFPPQMMGQASAFCSAKTGL